MSEKDPLEQMSLGHRCSYFGGGGCWDRMCLEPSRKGVVGLEDGRGTMKL